MSALASDSSPGPRSPGTPSVLSSVEALGLSALAGAASFGTQHPQQSPGLSGRNLACLKVFVGVTEMLAGSLGRAWFDVLETLQSSAFVLTPKRPPTAPGRKGSQLAIIPASPTPRRSSFVPSGSTSSPSGPNGNASPLGSSTSYPSHARRTSSHSLQHVTTQHQPSTLSEQEVDQVHASINHVFNATVAELSDEAFEHFLRALCRLSSEMMGLQPLQSHQQQPHVSGGSVAPSDAGSISGSQAGSTTELNVVVEGSPTLGGPPMPMRRRASGMHLLKSNVRSLIPRMVCVKCRTQDSILTHIVTCFGYLPLAASTRRQVLCHLQARPGGFAQPCASFDPTSFPRLPPRHRSSSPRSRIPLHFLYHSTPSGRSPRRSPDVCHSNLIFSVLRCPDENATSRSRKPREDGRACRRRKQWWAHVAVCFVQQSLWQRQCWLILGWSGAWSATSAESDRSRHSETWTRSHVFYPAERRS